jgi:hypothetical protein
MLKKEAELDDARPAAETFRKFTLQAAGVEQAMATAASELLGPSREKIVSVIVRAPPYPCTLQWLHCLPKPKCIILPLIPPSKPSTQLTFADSRGMSCTKHAQKAKKAKTKCD